MIYDIRIVCLKNSEKLGILLNNTDIFIFILKILRIQFHKQNN